MPINIHPKVGQILLCDFSQGFKEPEMVKKRPVLVIQSRDSLVTVVALSTAEPSPIKSFHYKIPKQSMPMLDPFQKNETWLKGDMIYTIGFHRLDLIQLGTRNPQTGKRIYFTQKLGREQMKDIYKCVLHGLNLGHLSPHI